MKTLSLSTILCIICLEVLCGEVKPQLKIEEPLENKPISQQKQQIVQNPPQNKQQSSFNIMDAISKIDIPKPDINIDFKGATDAIKQKLPDIPNIDIPKPDIKIDIKGIIDTVKQKMSEIDVEKIKEKLIWLKDMLLEMLPYVGIGVLCGALLPILLFLIVLALGFGVSGVVAGSLAACCQPPHVVAGSCFAILQHVGATAGLLIFIPKTSIIGGVVGLVFFTYCKATSYDPTIDISIDQIFQTLISIKDSILAALIAIFTAIATLFTTLLTTLLYMGTGLILGILVPITGFLLAVGGEFLVSHFNICCASPTSIRDVIKVIRKLRVCIDFVLHAGIIGAFAGLAYYVFVV